MQAFREWRGYGLNTLAMASGVPAEIIAEHEAGRPRLTPQELPSIGTALGIPPEMLQHDGDDGFTRCTADAPAQSHS